MKLWTHGALFIAFALATSTGAHAQGAPPAAAPQKQDPAVVARAEALYERAMKLVKDKKWGRAARLLETSNQLDPAMGTQYRLAECYERMGRLALAWSTFTAVARQAKAQGQEDRHQVAQLRADILEPWIAFLVLAVPEEVSRVIGLRITLGGAEVKRSQWQGHLLRGIPVDPGEYTIVAAAPGKTPAVRRIRVRESDSRVEVELPAMKDEIFVLHAELQ